ncbi:hypothetical protein H5410_057368 [Solanum commersonii]|uniref:Uncharacterized protein n=1 Tax=Solanum commersonii TaxID=4109 RepID=A0A9J5WNU0_SOLCO|nr:hypothetical protein H5410_057368 [Solanum commersonii]
MKISMEIKARKAVDFKRKSIFLEYAMQSDLMERTTSSATIEERHELHKNLLANCDQLTAESELLERTTSSATIKERHELHKKYLADCDQLTTEIKKAGKAVDFKRKRIFLEYDMQSELMERTTSSATIKEHHELHKKFIADCDQLTEECQKWLQPFSFAVSKVVKFNRNFEDNESLKVVLAMNIPMEIAHYKIIDLVAKLGETS